MKWWAFGIAMVVASQANAESRALMLEGGSSQLGFDAKTTFHAFSGRAARMSGDLVLEHERPVRARVACAVANLVTGEEGRDRDMWSSKYLDVGRFPEIVFTLESFEGPPTPANGSAQGTLNGTLRIKDSAVPVAVPVSYGWNGNELVVSGSFSYDIRKAGLTPPVVVLIQKMDPVVLIRFVLRFRERVH